MNSKAPRYGDRAEKKAIEQRGYERAESGRQWRDAVAPDGTSIEIKAAMRRRADGSEGRFRLFREPHRKLSKADGRYLFVAYRARGTGVEILATTEKAARAVRIGSWNRAGHATEGRSEQRRIPISEVF